LMKVDFGRDSAPLLLRADRLPHAVAAASKFRVGNCVRRHLSHSAQLMLRKLDHVSMEELLKELVLALVLRVNFHSLHALDQLVDHSSCVHSVYLRCVAKTFVLARDSTAR